MKKAIAAMVSVTLGFAVLAGCSSDDDSSSTSTTKAATSKEAVCDARTKLQKNLKSLLEDPSLVTGGKSGIQSALDGFETDVDNLADAAKSAYQPQIDAVQSALDDLKTAVGKLGEGSLTENLQDVGNAVTKVGSTTETLLDQVKADCPG